MGQAGRELSFLFRASRESRPVVLLGAGASYRSGIPLAGPAVIQIARAAYSRQVLGLDAGLANPKPSDFLPFLHRQPWFIPGEHRFAENFPLAVEHLLAPKEFRREFFEEMVKPPNGINDGYSLLARLVMRHLCWTILTTNFDDLAARSLRQLVPQIRDVVEINRTAGDLVRFSVYNRAQVVYLHGAAQYYRDKNLETETQRLDDELVRKIRPLLNDSPLIVIGYRGTEPSIMQHLLLEGVDDSGSYRHGIWWCARRAADLHPNVRALADRLGTNFRTIEIAGFDELMNDLAEELKDEVLHTLVSTPRGSTGDRPRFDHAPLSGAGMEDLDSALLTATLTEYCKRLKIPFPKGDEYWSLLVDQELVVREGDRYVPTRGGYLLFGLRVPERFPNARVSLTRGGKKRMLFEGNLTVQFRQILDALLGPEVNPMVRVKTERSSDERRAYPVRAITELLVNLLVHRDYDVQEISRIDHVPGVELVFINPGGLPAAVRKVVHPGKDGTFRPVRAATEVRNPVLADTFYGLGSMDKAGTGLADVDDLMRDQGGGSRFSIDQQNSSLRAALVQPLQKIPGQPVASPVVKSDLYLTNLLPFSVLPPAISSLPLYPRPQEDAPFFHPDEEPARLPLFITHGGRLFTFADLTDFKTFAERRGDYEKRQREPLDTYTSNGDKRRLLVWLLGKHWEMLLSRLGTVGLYVDRDRRRAFFHLLSGKGNTITYDSAKRRSVKREVVKRRQYPKWIEHENEGIAYWIVHYGNTWAVQIKPLYVFTKNDGKTPLSPFVQTRRSTQRMKFDRNPAVESDLAFWARLLSAGQPVISLGGAGVSDLLLDSNYCSAEIPEREP